MPPVSLALLAGFSRRAHISVQESPPDMTGEGDDALEMFDAMVPCIMREMKERRRGPQLAEAVFEGDEQSAEAEAKKSWLETTMTESYAPLRSGSVEAMVQAKQLIKAVVLVARSLHFDASLVESLAVVLDKVPENRDAGELEVLVQFEAAVSDRLGELLCIIESTESTSSASSTVFHIQD